MFQNGLPSILGCSGTVLVDPSRHGADLRMSTYFIAMDTPTPVYPAAPATRPRCSQTAFTLLFLSLLWLVSGGGLTAQAQLFVGENGTAGIGVAPHASWPLSVWSSSPGYSRVITAEYTATSGTNIAVAIAGYATGIYNGYGGYFRGRRFGIVADADVGGTSDLIHHGILTRASGATNTNYGVVAQASGESGTKIAISATASATAGTKYGVYAQATGSSGYKYGVYAVAVDPGGTNYAGYFNGQVVATGQVTASSFVTSSDERLKRNIHDLDQEQDLERLRQLRAVRYEYKSGEELSRDGFVGLQMPQDERLGFLAQEVEAAFPELVEEITYLTPPSISEIMVSPDRDTSEGESIEVETMPAPQVEVSYKAINYEGLIPVLVGAIQAQQDQIEALQAQVDALAKELGKESGRGNN